MQVTSGMLAATLAARMNAGHPMNTFINLLCGLIGGLAGGWLLGKLGMAIFIGESHLNTTGAVVNIIGSGIAGAMLVNLASSFRKFLSHDEDEE